MKLGLMMLPLLAVLATGCSSLQNGLYRGYSATPLDKDSLKSYVELTEALQTSDGKGTPLVRKECFAPTFENAKEMATCEAERNQAVAALVFASEQLCMEHRRSIYGNEAGWNIGLGTMTNVFAGAATVSAVTRTKSILAALALFSNSERSLLNETVYKTMLVTAVDKKIVEDRKSQMTEIYNATKTPMSKFGMSDALRSVTTLHASCSFMTGLLKALDEGTQSTTAQRLLRLKANLASTVQERKALGDKAFPIETENLDARYKALSDLILKLESE